MLRSQVGRGPEERTVRHEALTDPRPLSESRVPTAAGSPFRGGRLLRASSVFYSLQRSVSYSVLPSYTMSKRARIDVDEDMPSAATAGPEPGVEWKKDDEFWFADGTISLVASGVEFRVYKGILEAHSPVFADMFSLPQPLSDARPVVHLTDSVQDLRHVLRALFPSSETR